MSCLEACGQKGSQHCVCVSVPQNLHVYISEHEHFTDFNASSALFWEQPGLVYGDWTSGDNADGCYEHFAELDVPEVGPRELWVRGCTTAPCASWTPNAIQVAPPVWRAGFGRKVWLLPFRNLFWLCWFGGPHPAVPRSESWLCIQWSVVVGTRGGRRDWGSSPYWPYI